MKSSTLGVAYSHAHSSSRYVLIKEYEIKYMYLRAGGNKSQSTTDNPIKAN